MRNIDVVKAWSEGRKARSHSGNLETDGQGLWSYRLCIGLRVPGEQVVIDYTKGGGREWSVTTTRHVNMAKPYADSVVKPRPLGWSTPEEHRAGLGTDW